MPAFFDVWFLGDLFLHDTYQQFLSIKLARTKDKNVQSYLLNYFNIKALYNTSSSVGMCSACIINSLIEEINKTDVRLPRYLVVVIDRDLTNDLNDLSSTESARILQHLTDWLVKQINTVIRQKRIALYDVKPGVAADCHTKIVFVHMLRQVGSFHPDSKFNKVYSLKAKFNDALNDAAASIKQHMVTINDCNTYEHFDHFGNLTFSGKDAFWSEMDHLLRRFDLEKIKLLPNPKNPPRNRQHSTSTGHSLAKPGIPHKWLKEFQRGPQRK